MRLFHHLTLPSPGRRGSFRCLSVQRGATGQWLGFLLPLAVVALILPSSIARATTRTVSSLAVSGAGTLRDAVMASDNGDTINFSVTGVISLTSGELLMTKSMTITGPGEHLLEVTRGSGNDFRIFELDSGNVRISGLALTNGFAFGGLSASQGGCIALFGANLTLSDCIISGNTAQFDGGAIAVRNSRHPSGPALIYTLAEIDAFLTGVKNGEFDDLGGRV